MTLPVKHVNFALPDDWATGQGTLAESFPRWCQTGTIAPVTATYYFMQVFLRNGSTVNGSAIVVGVASAGLTFAKVGLHDVNGVFLGASADQVAAWATLGIHQQNFTAPIAITASGIYYAGFVAISATMPNLAFNRAPSVQGIGDAVGLAGKPLTYGSTTVVADVPNPLVVASGNVPGRFWIALTGTPP